MCYRCTPDTYYSSLLHLEPQAAGDTHATQLNAHWTSFLRMAYNERLFDLVGLKSTTRATMKAAPYVGVYGS